MAEANFQIFKKLKQYSLHLRILIFVLYMKSCVIFFNCHGGQIQNHLKSSKTFVSTYNVSYVPLYTYMSKELPDSVKLLLSTCDLLILQYIKNKDRKSVHHEYIQGLVKKTCNVIKIHHYAFSGYHFKHDIVNDTYINEHKTKDELDKYIENIHIDSETDIVNNLESELEYVKSLDEMSDINCYEYIKQNYQKHFLFNHRSYPTYLVFHHISQEILRRIGINEVIEPVWSAYASNRNDIIYPCVKRYLKLEFNVKYNYNCNLTEYIVCCKQQGENSLSLGNRKKREIRHSNAIKDIIASKKYR